MQLRCVFLAFVIALGSGGAAAAAPECVYVDEADPLSRIWFEEDGTLVTERLGVEVRYPTSTGGGTGIMTRLYHPEDISKSPIAVLFYSLSDIAKPDAPQGIAFAFSNVYLETCSE